MKPGSPNLVVLRPSAGQSGGKANRNPLTFLASPHICSKTRKGKFTILHKKIRKKWSAEGGKEVHLVRFGVIT